MICVALVLSTPRIHYNFVAVIFDQTELRR